jgi:hypothetical protein
LKYIGGDLKLFALIAASGLIVFVFWLALEKGHDIVGLGQQKSEEIIQRYPIQAEQAPDLQQALKRFTAEKRAPAPRPISRQQTGDVYKWVDEKGTVSFSDRPMNPGAERIAVQPAHAYSFPQASQPYRDQGISRKAVSTNQPIARVQTVASTRSPQTQRVATGTFITGGGHRITASASHFGTWLTFEGRVSGGEQCQSLEMTGYMKNNAGKTVWLRTTADNVGGPSRLFKSRPARVSDLKCGWELVRVDAICVGN